MGGGGAGNAVGPPAAADPVAALSAGAAADCGAAAPLSTGAMRADQGCVAPAAAGEGAAVLAPAGAGEAEVEEGRFMRRKSAPSTEVDRGGSIFVAAAL